MTPKKKTKKAALLFGEGRKEKTFFNFLLGTAKFRELEDEWFIATGHASGSSCRDVLDKCISAKHEREYELILCFIDTDKLAHDYPTTHEKEKEKIEAIARENGIEIFWQESNHEKVLEEATGGKIKTKAGMKGRLKRHQERVLASDFVKKILRYFRG